MTQHVACDVDLLVSDVAAQGDAHFLLEELGEVAGVKRQGISDGFDCEVLLDVGSDVVDGDDDVARNDAVLGEVAHLSAVGAEHVVLDAVDFVDGACGIDEFDVDVAQVICDGDLKAGLDAETADEGGEDDRVVFDVADLVGT